MRIWALYNLIYSSPLFVLGTTIDSRHTSVARKLTQRKFYRKLVVSLCHSIPVRPAATQHHADNTLERLRGHHYSERGKKRRDCVCAAVVAQERKGTSQTVFGTCSGRPPLCIDSCFMAYHSITFLITAHWSMLYPMCNPSHFSYLRIHWCTSTLYTLPQCLSIYYSDTVLYYNRTLRVLRIDNALPTIVHYLWCTNTTIQNSNLSAF